MLSMNSSSLSRSASVKGRAFLLRRVKSMSMLLILAPGAAAVGHRTKERCCGWKEMRADRIAD